MTERTRRIPVSPEYANALGYAVYCFCYLEWGAIGIIERFEPKYVNKIQTQKKTAGDVAKDLNTFATGAKGLEEPIHKRLVAFATLFKDLVDRRNWLVHGKPFTGENGEQRLHYESKAVKVDWTLPEIIELAKQFEAASIEAGELFHKYLAHRR
jgi:hypothetical protein